MKRVNGNCMHKDVFFIDQPKHMLSDIPFATYYTLGQTNNIAYNNIDNMRMELTVLLNFGAF